MGKNLKKQKRKNNRAENRELNKEILPRELLINKDTISPEVAVFDEEDKENQFYKISFVNYKDSLCQINDLSSISTGKKILDKIRLMGKCKTLKDINNVLEKIKVHRGGKGNYKTLYKGLGKDVDIFEDKCDRKKSRIFYSIFEPNKIIGIIAITTVRHLE